MIYYIVSTRCEMDINGFESVFEQFLNAKEVQFLIDSLRELHADRLAELFEQAFVRLQDAGFYDDESGSVADLNPDEVDVSLNDIASELSDSDGMWELDERLVRLIPDVGE